MNWDSVGLRKTLERPTCHLKHDSSPNLNEFFPVWPICTRWVGSTAVASNNEDRVKKQTSIPIVWGSKTWEGYGSFSLSLWWVRKEKTDFEMSEFQRLSVSIAQSAFLGGRLGGKECQQDAVKVKIGRKVTGDKSQGRQCAPRGGEEPSLCAVRCCSALD